MSNTTTVDLSVTDGIARITLTRPDRLNALTRNLMLDLADTLKRASEDDSIRVISITGSGRGFCAGQDLSERDPRKLDGPRDLEAIQKELFHPIVLAMRQAPKPVVACVNGIAAGAGAALALAADIVLASKSARFAFSFSKVGLSVDAGGGYALVKAIGPARTRAILMLGETLPATDAAQAGLIWKAVDDAELQTAHEALLSQLAASPRQALQSIKKAVTAAESATIETYLAEEARLQGLAGRDPDYAEGVLGFLEKRAPQFR